MLHPTIRLTAESKVLLPCGRYARADSLRAGQHHLVNLKGQAVRLLHVIEDPRTAREGTLVQTSTWHSPFTLLPDARIARGKAMQAPHFLAVPKAVAWALPSTQVLTLQDKDRDGGSKPVTVAADYALGFVVGTLLTCGFVHAAPAMCEVHFMVPADSDAEDALLLHLRAAFGTALDIESSVAATVRRVTCRTPWFVELARSMQQRLPMCLNRRYLDGIRDGYALLPTDRISPERIELLTWIGLVCNDGRGLFKEPMSEVDPAFFVGTVKHQEVSRVSEPLCVLRLSLLDEAAAADAAAANGSSSGIVANNMGLLYDAPGKLT